MAYQYTASITRCRGTRLQANDQSLPRYFKSSTAIRLGNFRKPLPCMTCILPAISCNIVLKGVIVCDGSYTATFDLIRFIQESKECEI